MIAHLLRFWEMALANNFSAQLVQYEGKAAKPSKLLKRQNMYREEG